MNNNMKIRKALKETGVKYWELARLMGISDGTLCRRLRDEIPAEEQERIVKLILKKANERMELVIRGSENVAG